MTRMRGEQRRSTPLFELTARRLGDVRRAACSGLVLLMVTGIPLLSSIAVTGEMLSLRWAALIIVAGGVAKALVGAHRASHIRERGMHSGRRTTALAAMIGGRRRARLREEWLAILEGSPEDGVFLTAGQRRRYACGFLLAAVRMRSHDFARPLWRPVDWVLATEDRSNALVAVPVALLAAYLFITEGLHGLIVENWLGCPALAGVLYVFIRWLRRVRAIEIADLQRRRQTQ
jgi:hypothetical protein